MQGYYFIRVRKNYASAIIEDLQKMDAVELLEANDTSIPQWQQKEVLARLDALDNNPETAIDWTSAMTKINGLAK